MQTAVNSASDLCYNGRVCSASKKKVRGTMHIDSYSFGEIVIGKERYTADLMLAGDRIFPGWRRKTSHGLEMSDLLPLIEHNPEILIIGTGFLGIMKVPRQLISALAKKGIECRTMRTGKAVDLYNEIDGDKIAFAAHLTC